jgi:hypothetical protein
MNHLTAVSRRLGIVLVWSPRKQIKCTTDQQNISLSEGSDAANADASGIPAYLVSLFVLMWSYAGTKYSFERSHKV